MITVPAVTGTVSTRPAAGASTLPSVTCCSITARSAVRDLSRLVATSKADWAASRTAFGVAARE